MPTEEILTYSITTFAMLFFYRIVTKSSRKVIEMNPNGLTILRLHIVYQILGFMALLFSLIFSIGILLNEENAILLVFFSWLLFGFLAVFLLLWYYRHEVQFDNEQLIVSNWLGKSQKLKWSELEDVRFHLFSGLIKMEAKGKVVKLHQHLVGLNTLLAVMEQNTSFTQAELRLPK
ncbi:MAG: hypothetical protein AAFR87_20500 [Bacteroidota bacterium]